MTQDEMLKIVEPQIKALNEYVVQLLNVTDLLKKLRGADINFASLAEINKTLDIPKMNIRGILVIVKRALLARAKSRIQELGFNKKVA